MPLDSRALEGRRGGALLTAKWVFVALAVRSIGGLPARVPDEEQMMIEELAKASGAYVKRTGGVFARGGMT